MDPATGAVALSVGAKLVGSISGSRARKKARKRRRKMIEEALRELNPQQIADLAGRLGMNMSNLTSAASPAQTGELESRARTFGINPANAVAAFQGQTQNMAASNAFEGAMGLAGARANRTLGYAAQVQPNYNTANALGALGSLTDTYALYKGYRG